MFLTRSEFPGTQRYLEQQRETRCLVQYFQWVFEQRQLNITEQDS